MTEWVLVTGGAKRLGRAVALEAGAQGWNVAIHFNSSRADAEKTGAAVNAKGARAALIKADLSDPENVEDVIAAAEKASGARMAALVNCAAIFEWDNLATLTPAHFRAHMDINTLAPLSLTRAFARALGDGQRGAVVNFLDFKLASPYPDHLSYTLSKYALDGVTQMLARVLAPQVRVNAVAPGYVLAAPGQAEADHRRLHAQNPLHYGVTPEDVARTALFLLGNRAITGQTVFVDSGLRFQAHERDFAFR